MDEKKAGFIRRKSMLICLILAVVALAAVVAVSVLGLLVMKAVFDDILEEFR